jgi:hypothetical protein
MCADPMTGVVSRIETTARVASLRSAVHFSRRDMLDSHSPFLPGVGSSCQTLRVQGIAWSLPLSRASPLETPLDLRMFSCRLVVFCCRSRLASGSTDAPTSLRRAPERHRRTTKALWSTAKALRESTSLSVVLKRASVISEAALWYYRVPLEDCGGAPPFPKSRRRSRRDIGELRCRFEEAGGPSEYCSDTLKSFKRPLGCCGGPADSRMGRLGAAKGLRENRCGFGALRRDRAVERPQIDGDSKKT